MKTNKNVTKKTSKIKNKQAYKPEYVIDIVGIHTEYDTALEIALTKVFNNNCNLTESDMEVIVTAVKTSIVLEMLCKMFTNGNAIIIDNGCIITGNAFAVTNNSSNEKKPNVFKRFWNWITRKK